MMEAIDVACPQCTAAPGERCYIRLPVTHSKKRLASFHAPRVRTASTRERHPSYS